MNKPTTKFKANAQVEVWRSEASQKVRIPERLRVEDIEDLCSWMQELADGYFATDEHPSLGPLEFRFSLDDEDNISVIRVYFQDKHNQRSRFTRLVRES